MATAAPESTWTPAYQLDEDGEDYVVRIPRSMVARDRLQRILAWVELEHIKSKIDISDEEIDALAREVKGAVWEKNRHRVEGL